MTAQNAGMKTFLLMVASAFVGALQPYPGAAAYRLQLTEQSDLGDYEGQRRVFDWRSRPVVSETAFDLTKNNVVLKKGHYYTIEIEALDERNRPLSQSTRRFYRADFRAVE